MEELHVLPARVAAVESQILQLRGEMNDGFSAIVERLGRHEEQFEQFEHVRGRMEQGFDAMGQKIDEIGRHMRVLHEDVLNRFSLLQDRRRGKK